jgi:hypothetical protein
MLARLALSIVLLAAIAVPAVAQAKTRTCGTARFDGVT